MFKVCRNNIVHLESNIRYRKIHLKALYISIKRRLLEVSHSAVTINAFFLSGIIMGARIIQLRQKRRVINKIQTTAIAPKTNKFSKIIYYLSDIMGILLLIKNILSLKLHTQLYNYLHRH